MTRPLLSMLVLAAACASTPAPTPESPAAPSSESSPAPAPAPASASASAPAAPPPGPPPTGGVVLIGEIVSPPRFDPKPTLDGLKPSLLSCYNQARQNNPPLHGKLKLRISVNEGGSVLLVDAEPGGTAGDPALVACLGDAIKGAHFPTPPGMATITAPLVFRP